MAAVSSFSLMLWHDNTLEETLIHAYLIKSTVSAAELRGIRREMGVWSCMMILESLEGCGSCQLESSRSLYTVVLYKPHYNITSNVLLIYQHVSVLVGHQGEPA
jgi:hypothetical protein